MGTVYRAHDELLGRAVAIKTLHPRSDSAIRERFLREARAIGAIHHPHILAVHDAGTEGETPYLVIELCSGGSLGDHLETAPLSIEAVRQLGIQIAGALAAAHAANILHRDVKPANILCTESGAWKLADFGIARLPDSTLTMTGQFLGSPSYAAPESLRAGEFTPASDVYGLGATLYEASCGAPPHGQHDLASLIRKLDHDPIPLRAKVSVGEAIDAAIMRALARDPAQRPSALELAHLLATDRAPVAAPGSLPVAAPAGARLAWSRGRSFAVGAIALAILLAVAIVGRGTPSPGPSNGADPSTEPARSDPAGDRDEPPVEAGGHKRHKDHGDHGDHGGHRD